jgi:hypothetical protein
MVENLTPEQVLDLPSESSVDPVKKRRPTKREEAKKLSFLWDLFRTAVRDRSKFDKDWNDYYKRYRHDHWKNMAGWKATPVFNKIFSNIESITPLITDHRVEPLLLPRTEKDAPLQDTMQNVMDYILESNRMEDVAQNVVRGAEIYGSWFFKVMWDQDLQDGRGDVVITDVSCRQVFPAPGYRTIEECPWFMVARVIDEAELRREFGDEVDIDSIEEGVEVKKPDEFQNLAGASRMSPDQTGSNNQSFTGTTTSGLSGIDEVAGSDSMNRPRGLDIGIPVKKYTHLEIWINDDTADEQGDPLFPEGRVIDVVNNRIVRDQENQLGFIPYVKYDAYSIPEQFFGQGTAEVVWPLQQTLNKILGQMIDHTNLSVNPPIKRTWNAIPEHMEGKLFSYPGAIIPVEDPQGLEYMQVPRVDSNTFALIQQVEQMMDTVTGIFDVTQGQRPKNVESAQGIALIQEGSQTRIRQKTRNLDDASYKVYLRVLKLIKRFYTSERIISFFDDEGQATQLNLNQTVATSDIADTQIPQGLGIEELDPNTSQRSEFTPGQSFLNDQGDVIQPVNVGDGIIEWMANPIYRADFDLHIIPGSSLPVEQRIRSQEAFRLYELRDEDGTPLIDEEAVLEALQWNKRQAILGRRAERKDFRGQIEQMQAQLEQIVGQLNQTPAAPAIQDSTGTIPGGQDLTTLQQATPQPF